MKTGSFLLGFCLLTTFVFGQHKPAYILYNAKGKKIDYEKIQYTFFPKTVIT